MQPPLRPSRTPGRCVNRYVGRRASLAAVALCACLPGVRSAAAADGDPVPGADYPSPITDRFDMRIIYFAPTVTSEIRIDPPGKPLGGTALSGQADLGWPTKDHEGRLEIGLRLRERNLMRVDYLSLGLSGTALFNRSIIFGDQTFTVPPSYTVQSSLTWRMMGFTYTRSFIRTSHFEFGAGLAVHLLDADAIGSVPARLQQHETSVAGAFPTLAVEGTWRIWRGLSLNGRGQWFGTTIHGFSGSLGDYHGDLQYRIKAPFAIGAGYQVIRVKYQSLTSGTPGRFFQELSGPEAFVRVSF